MLYFVVTISVQVLAALEMKAYYCVVIKQYRQHTAVSCCRTTVSLVETPSYAEGDQSSNLHERHNGLVQMKSDDNDRNNRIPQNHGWLYWFLFSTLSNCTKFYLLYQVIKSDNHNQIFEDKTCWFLITWNEIQIYLKLIVMLQ